ncbi:MAG: hypothetical protein WAN71_26830 [Mycobacterium sp.]|uniref:hypothetical protein n=1 Tax=Mycobacterium sp. TaxID=1785 RepID=UPI003BB1D89A
MREPPQQRLEQTLDFVHARAYLHQVPRRRGAAGVELLVRDARHAVCEFVQLGGLGLQKAFEDPGLS